jgi:hypothetical protein
VSEYGNKSWVAYNTWEFIDYLLQNKLLRVVNCVAQTSVKDHVIIDNGHTLNPSKHTWIRLWYISVYLSENAQICNYYYITARICLATFTHLLHKLKARRKAVSQFILACRRCAYMPVSIIQKRNAAVGLLFSEQFKTVLCSFCGWYIACYFQSQRKLSIVKRTEMSEG